MKKSIACIILFFCLKNIVAQDKKAVAIMPFLSTIPEHRNHAAQLQSIAVQTFTTNSSVKFIDRSTDPQVVKELDNQIREQSMSSKMLVQQGKLSGALEIIVGTLSSVNVETTQTNGIGGVSKKYIANISFSLQNIDATTGLMISSKDFNGNTHPKDAATKILEKQKGFWGDLGKIGNELMADTKDEAIRKAIIATKAQIANWINNLYPPVIKIIDIESRDKKGFPSVVVISGFETTGLSVGKTIVVKEITLMDDGKGGKLERVKKIGELKVSEIQGQVTLCKVKEGEDVLEAKMKSNATLKFIID